MWSSWLTETIFDALEISFTIKKVELREIAENKFENKQPQEVA